MIQLRDITFLTLIGFAIDVIQKIKGLQTAFSYFSNTWENFPNFSEIKERLHLKFFSKDEIIFTDIFNLIFLLLYYWLLIHLNIHLKRFIRLFRGDLSNSVIAFRS